MFPGRYFAGRYFAPRYFPRSTGAAAGGSLASAHVRQTGYLSAANRGFRSIVFILMGV